MIDSDSRWKHRLGFGRVIILKNPGVPVSVKANALQESVLYQKYLRKSVPDFSLSGNDRASKSSSESSCNPHSINLAAHCHVAHIPFQLHTAHPLKLSLSQGPTGPCSSSTTCCLLEGELCHTVSMDFLIENQPLSQIAVDQGQPQTGYGYSLRVYSCCSSFLDKISSQSSISVISMRPAPSHSR